MALRVNFRKFTEIKIYIKGTAMKIVIAPDSFKGCLPAREVARIIADAIREAHPDWDTVEFPLADGGEGTLDAIGNSMRRVTVRDPLGRPVEARYGAIGGTAVIEVAEACGLRLLSPGEQNPLKASTCGVGDLLLAARKEGFRSFLIGLGGSATCDGGMGMMGVPGIREAMEGCTVELLSDVDSPFIGPMGAARVFAPQKGASPEDVEVLELRMEATAARILADTGVDVRSLPGAGAAGGLGGAFMAYFHARSSSGIGRILELTRFADAIKSAGLIITGEGKSDRQTLLGKVPMGVLRHSCGITVLLLSGRIEDRDALSIAGFQNIVQVSPEDLPLEEALRPDVAAANLRRSVTILPH